MSPTLENGKPKKLTLNCDLGESFGIWKMGNDAEIMPFIDCANIACGFHAGDPVTMYNTVALAVANDVSIGAHPGYPDKEGFGRRSMRYNRPALIAMLLYQVGALQAICHSQHTQVDYIKPHGALYNDMMANIELFESVALAAKSLKLPLMVQALPTDDLMPFISIATKLELPLLFEGFADRQYQKNGKLVARNQTNAVIHDVSQIIHRCNTIIEKGLIISEEQTELALNINSLCVHGDTPEALAMVKALRQFLDTLECN